MRDREAGLTLVEIMISLLLVSVAAAFVFSIQMRTSTALRDQQAIAEMQQTLRSASDQLVRDLRGAGYLARSVRVANPAGTGTCTPDNVNLFELSGVTVDNSSSAPDLLRLVYADTTAQAVVGTHTATDSVVDSTTGFSTGDLVLLVSKEPDTTFGVGCIVQLTNVVPASNLLEHAPGIGVNLAANCQCSAVAAANLVITKVNLRAYRISPSDPRGVLQMSPTAGIVNDWVDMAVGVVDLQMALQVATDATGATPPGPDDIPDSRQWRSGDNMETPLVLNERVLSASVTLVAKTSKEVNGVVLDHSPDLFEPDAGISDNRVGDRTGTLLPVTDMTSMYYGDFVYRHYSSTVDLRNTRYVR